MARELTKYDEFKIRLKNGGYKARSETLNIFLLKSLCKAVKRGTNPKGKGVSKPAKTYLQNSVVKVSYTDNKSTQKWSSHGKYLQRDGAQIEGRKGVGFDENNESVDMTQRLDSWQKAEDERFFRVIVSPEQAERLDLREHTRELMKKVGADWNMKIEWVAIEHTNTDNPHVHIAIRGNNLDGQSFRIDREYIKGGMRLRSQETATQKLGVRLRSDILARRQKAITQNRFTELDRELLRLSHNATNLICFVGNIPQSKAETENRMQLIGRLQYLQSLGFVEKEGLISWKISENLEQGLRAYQLSQDIIKRKTQHIGVITEPDLPLVYSKLKVGEEIIGRVVGFGIHKEDVNSHYMMIEGIDGKIHYTHPKMKILKERSELKIRNGDVVALEVKFFYENNQKRTFLNFENLGGVTNLKNITGITKADEYVLKQLVKDKGIFDIPFPEKSFRGKFYSQMKVRMEHWRKLNVIDEEGMINKKAIKDLKMKQNQK